jgi:DNA invertase Pin-like site-specific DNA recombinase
MNPRHLRPEDLRGRRWRGLVRESTAAQARKEATPERQRTDIRRAAEELGLVGVEPLFYERVGSGEEEDVPELEQALTDARAGQYDVLLVLTTSRFARNRDEAIRRKAQFATAGIPIYFVQDRIVSGARSSQLLEGVREVIDEEENEQRRFFIAGGLRERQKAGKWHGRIPYGYRRELVDFPDGTRGWDGGLEPDTATAPLVRAMFAQVTTGGSPRDVAFRLNMTGQRSPTGGPWIARTVKEIIRNPVYEGRLVRYRRPSAAQPFYYDASDAQDGHMDLGERFPGLVSAEAWRAANEALRLRWRGGAGVGRSRHYPLSSVLRCGACGQKMTGTHGGGETRYYRCHGRAMGTVCEAPSIRADIAERAFADFLSRYRLPVDWREEIARTRVTTIRTDEADRQRRLTERLTRLRNLYSWGHIQEAEYRTAEREIRSELALVQMPTGASFEDVAIALERLGPAWASAEPGVQGAVPALMLHAGEVANGKVEWVVRAELRPLLDLCIPVGVSRVLGQPVHTPRWTVRYSA